MIKILGKWLKIYEDEIGLFLWSAALLFLIRSSNILFNNFAETAFLKRYGVEYLPIVYVANSITTFIIMGFLTGMIARLPGSRLLGRMLIFCGCTVAALRFVVPLGFEILYPILFVLKSQYEVLLGLVFWNLANDLFNTRQSKRIFPLITAGGVLGSVIGSFCTPLLAQVVVLDNLMFAYLGTTLAGAFVVKGMGVRYPTLLIPEKRGKTVKGRSNLIEEFKKVIPMMKESNLVKILILITLLPNIVIPIINYQFNFAVDQQFATEGLMIKFFGYFRGALNIVSFILLLFVGKIYGRWGLPVALMFHPFNYILAFMAFLFRFDIFSAVYARISTNVLRTTINNPARAVLMGLFPVSYRAVIRPFLRGTIVRVGILVGSGVIMLSEGLLLHPKYLSVFATACVSVWVLSTIWLKRIYSNILLDLITSNMLDLKSLEPDEVGRIFKDKNMQTQLMQAFYESRGNTSIWYADLMKSLDMGNLDAYILDVIQDRDDRTKIGLLNLLSAKAGRDAVQPLKALTGTENLELTIAAIKAGARLPSDVSSGYLKEVYESFQNPEVRALALVGLYGQDTAAYGAVIDQWLASENADERRAGIIAAGGSGKGAYAAKLTSLLEDDEDETLIPPLLDALSQLEIPDINQRVVPYLESGSESIRLSALQALLIKDDEALRAAIPLLGDPHEAVRELAMSKLHQSPHQNPELLIESLSLPNQKTREGVFELLESLKIKDVNVFRFARSQLERAYRNLAEAEGLRQALPDGPARNLLIDHLTQKRNERLETVLRVLATQDRSGEMRIIWRGVSSTDPRQKSNAVEALEDTVGRSLSKLMVPLLENVPVSESLAVGRKNFEIPVFDSDPREICNHLLVKYDWVTVVLCLNLIGKESPDGFDRSALAGFMNPGNTHIKAMAEKISHGKPEERKKENVMEESISIPDKILHLRGIQIFEGLSVGELAAIASVTEELVKPEGEDVIREGEQGETMYMIISGEVLVIKGQEGGEEIELDRIAPGDYFGEMALFEDQVRSATIRTVQETRLLVLHKQEFSEIVREYPQIALHICKVLSQRLRRLHEKVQKYEKSNP